MSYIKKTMTPILSIKGGGQIMFFFKEKLFPNMPHVRPHIMCRWAQPVDLPYCFPGFLSFLVVPHTFRIGVYIMQACNSPAVELTRREQSMDQCTAVMLIIIWDKPSTASAIPPALSKAGGGALWAAILC